MTFSSFEFLAFFVGVLVLLVVLPARFRKLLLLLASYLFYALWNVRFTLLLLASTAIDFLIGRLVHRTQNQAQRTWLVWTSIVGNLGLLGFFKYYNFFIDSVNPLLSTWSLHIPYLDLLLPIGISFYTFRTMSYTLDIYWHKFEPVDSLIDFCLFAAFFPELIAGPIARANEFLPQLEKPIQITAANVWAGSQIFIVGLFKKFMIADAVSPFVDAVYAYPEYYSSTTVWLAVLAYALQFYGDFSGYSDMAIGCARMLGFRSGPNFEMPYLSRDIQEFWRRWHISLSNWLRDYLYIPLGGNRKGHVRTYVNLVVTMVLGGLWHGASWTFVLWGAVHGLALAIHRWLGGRSSSKKSTVQQILGTAGTFLFVTLAWVLFRAPDVQTMVTIFGKLLFINAGGAMWTYHAALAAAAWVVLGHIAGSLRKKKEPVVFKTPLSYAAALAVILTLLVIYVFAPTSVSPFIYFQF